MCSSRFFTDSHLRIWWFHPLQYLGAETANGAYLHPIAIATENSKVFGEGMEYGNGMEWSGVDEVDEVEGWIPPKNKYLTDQVESSCGTASGLAVDHEVSGVPAL